MGSVAWARSVWASILGICGLAFGLVFAGAAVADESSEHVENFTFSAWDVNYQIGLDAQGRAHADVTEELVAEFPQTDQNRGIVRALPLRYQGAPAEPEKISVTDGAGNAVPFEVENDDGFRSILVGDDAFVHGSQTYVISYTVDDVMHATEDADEFYWDLVPVDRQQPIDDVTATVTFDDELGRALTGAAACYRGTPEDTQECAVDAADSTGSFVISETDLPAGEGLTVAIGAAPGTVTQPPERQPNFLLDGMPLVLVAAAVLVSAGGAIAVYAMIRRYRNDTRQISTEYGIPEGMNPVLASRLTGRGGNSIVAMILHLAVRGVLRIEDPPDPDDKKAKPVLRLIDPQLATDPLETDLLAGMIPSMEPGETFTFPKNSKAFTKAAQQVAQDSGDAVLERGYQRKVLHRGAALAGWISILLLIPAVVLLIMGASRDNTVMTVFSIVFGLIAVMLAIICVVPHRVLTLTGAALRRQLERMREIMKASEADRVKMLQSFSSARRTSTPSHETSSSAILELYDQFLPYAVLFGMEKDWADVLASSYQHHQVTFLYWYPALLQDGTGNLQDSLSSMLSSVSAAAATSSPTAGSTGGGVAGGGGGGGAAGGR